MGEKLYQGHWTIGNRTATEAEAAAAFENLKWLHHVLGGVSGVSKHLGLTEGSVRQYYTGKAKPSKKTCIAIAALYVREKKWCANLNQNSQTNYGNSSKTVWNPSQYAKQ